MKRERLSESKVSIVVVVFGGKTRQRAKRDGWREREERRSMMEGAIRDGEKRERRRIWISIEL